MIKPKPPRRVKVICQHCQGENALTVVIKKVLRRTGQKKPQTVARAERQAKADARKEPFNAA